MERPSDAGRGLAPNPATASSRIRVARRKHIVSDGPFSETKELLAGFWLWQVKSRDEAIAWVKRIPFHAAAGTEVEIRQVFEADDFGPALTPEVRAAEERMRAEAAGRR